MRNPTTTQVPDGIPRRADIKGAHLPRRGPESRAHCSQLVFPLRCAVFAILGPQRLHCADTYTAHISLGLAVSSCTSCPSPKRARAHQASPQQPPGGTEPAAPNSWLHTTLTLTFQAVFRLRLHNHTRVPLT